MVLTGLVPQPSYMLQSEELRASLLARYPPEKLFQVERNFNAAQDLDVSLLEGDLVGVIKKKDPMGSQNRWLIDNGGEDSRLWANVIEMRKQTCEPLAKGEIIEMSWFLECGAPRLIVKPHASDCICFDNFQRRFCYLFILKLLLWFFFSKSPRQLPSESVNCV